MTHAQRILLVSHLLLRRIREAGIKIEHNVLLEFYRRVERWCAEAQMREGST
jgi:hypothetical protein